MTAAEVILIVFGVLLCGVGIATVVMRRRFAANVERAGIRIRLVPTAMSFAIGVAVMQILLGVLFLGGALWGRIPSHRSGILSAAMFRSVGGMAPVIEVAAILLGVAAAATGFMLARRGWQHRATWGGESGSGIVIPDADGRRLFAGTVVCALGAVAIVFGALLLSGII